MREKKTVNKKESDTSCIINRAKTFLKKKLTNVYIKKKRVRAEIVFIESLSCFDVSAFSEDR